MPLAAGSTVLTPKDTQVIAALGRPKSVNNLVITYAVACLALGRPLASGRAETSKDVSSGTQAPA